MDCQALPGIDVKDGETPEASATSSSIMDKVKGPLVVRSGRYRQGSPQGKGELLLPFDSQRKAFLFVQSFCSFMVHYKTLFLQKDVKPSYPVSRFLVGDLSHPGNNLCIHAWS